MKKKLLYLVLLSFIIACSKSGSDSVSDSPSATEMMNEPADTPEDSDASTPIMGEFMDGAHPTSGTVTLNAERTELMIKDFRSDDGPILELYIANDLQATEYTTLGELQGLEGDYIYDVPSGIDFETHNYVLVWCVEFSVSFGHAILE